MHYLFIFFQSKKGNRLTCFQVFNSHLDAESLPLVAMAPWMEESSCRWGDLC